LVKLLQTGFDTRETQSAGWLGSQPLAVLYLAPLEETTPQGDKPYQTWCSRTYGMAMGSQPYGWLGYFV